MESWGYVYPKTQKVMLVEFRFILQNVCLLKITPAKYFLCIKKDIADIYFFSSYLSFNSGSHSAFQYSIIDYF